MNLIQQLSAKACEPKTQFPEAEKVARELLGLSENDEFKANPAEDTQRIVSYWRGRAQNMTAAELTVAVGNDLEQLDYNPADISKMVPRIVKAIKK